jgi:hypothetical protein
MTARETLATCVERGISVSIHDGKLRLAPAAAVDPDLLEDLRCHKSAIIELLAGPAVDHEGLPFEQCRVCGAPNWWSSDAFPGWHCSYCLDRPEPFWQGRVVVVCGGQWGRQ